MNAGRGYAVPQQGVPYRNHGQGIPQQGNPQQGMPQQTMPQRVAPPQYAQQACMAGGGGAQMVTRSPYPQSGVPTRNQAQPGIPAQAGVPARTQAQPGLPAGQQVPARQGYQVQPGLVSQAAAQPAQRMSVQRVSVGLSDPGLQELQQQMATQAAAPTPVQAEARIPDRSQTQPYKEHILHIWRSPDNTRLAYCEGGSGGTNDGIPLDVTAFTSGEWACFSGVLIHGGMTLDMVKKAGFLDKIRDGNVPLALAKPCSIPQWDAFHRNEMGGQKSWAVIVFAQPGTSKPDFMNNPREYVVRNDAGTR